MSSFYNAQSGEFAADLGVLAAKLGVSVYEAEFLSKGQAPPGLAQPSVQSIAPWAAYQRSAAPAAAFGQDVYEVAPANGVQQWAVHDSTQPLAALQTQRMADVAAYRASKVAAGYTSAGQVVDIDDAGRADLTSMMASANASLITVLAGTAAWPSNYATGWVSRSGGLLPLPKATDGIKLAAAALNFYSALIQHEAALKKAVSAVATLAALRAIDITAGWPAST